MMDPEVSLRCRICISTFYPAVYCLGPVYCLRFQVRRAAWVHHADTYLITLEGWSPVEAGKELIIYVMKNLLDADAKDVSYGFRVQQHCLISRSDRSGIMVDPVDMEPRQALTHATQARLLFHLPAGKDADGITQHIWDCNVDLPASITALKTMAREDWEVHVNPSAGFDGNDMCLVNDGKTDDVGGMVGEQNCSPYEVMAFVVPQGWLRRRQKLRRKEVEEDAPRAADGQPAKGQSGRRAPLLCGWALPMMVGGCMSGEE